MGEIDGVVAQSQEGFRVWQPTLCQIGTSAARLLLLSISRFVLTFAEGVKISSHIICKFEVINFFVSNVAFLGGCLTWSGKAKEGEPILRKALQMDTSIPNGYSLLAQNLLMQV